MTFWSPHRQNSTMARLHGWHFGLQALVRFFVLAFFPPFSFSYSPASGGLLNNVGGRAVTKKKRYWRWFSFWLFNIRGLGARFGSDVLGVGDGLGDPGDCVSASYLGKVLCI